MSAKTDLKALQKKLNPQGPQLPPFNPPYWQPMALAKDSKGYCEHGYFDPAKGDWHPQGVSIGGGELKGLAYYQHFKGCPYKCFTLDPSLIQKRST